MSPKGLALHLQIWVILILLGVTQAELRVKKCFKGTDEEPQGEATLACPVGSVISLNDALLGKNRWYECVLTEEDCMHSTRIFTTCEGLNTCTKTFRTYSARCGYVTILLVSYECIPVAIPTTPTRIVTTYPRVGDTGPFNVGNAGAGDGSPGIGKENNQNRNMFRKNDSTEEEDPEIGLLVATIAASLVTGVMLIIAIIMTIRRILNYPAWLHRRHRNDSSRWDACIERACFQVDKFPCFSGSESPEGTPEQALRSENKSSCAPISSDDQVPSIQRTRMTPIGQESSDSDVTIQSENTNDADSEGSFTSEHAQTSDTVEDDVTRSSFRLKQRPDICDPCNHSRNNHRNDNVETVVEMLNNNIVKYSCLNNGSCSNTPVEFKKMDSNQKHRFDIERQNNNNTLNNEKILWEDIRKETALRQDLGGKVLEKCINNNNVNNNNEEVDFTTIKAKYSAIVVPNTETFSRC